jgi:hypothetical protein
MKRSFTLIVAAILGAAVSVPAQLQHNGLAGRHSRGPVSVAQVQPSVKSANRTARMPRNSRSVSASKSFGAARRSQSRVGGVRNAENGRYRTSARYSNSASIRLGFGRRSHSSHGHWVTHRERVLVPGYWAVERHAAEYGWVYDSCGHRQWSVINPAHNHRVWVPSRYENRSCRRWVCY